MGPIQKTHSTQLKTFIYVSLQKEGIHCYPAAANIPGVEFLQYPHRHIFHIKAKIEVFHDDRELEFILIKRYIEQLYTDSTLQLNHKSCEMIAKELLNELQKKLNEPRDITIEVSEDNENGAIIEFTTKLVNG